MSIETIFASEKRRAKRVSRSGGPAKATNAASQSERQGLAEWHFSASAEVQLYQDKAKAGHSTLTLGVLPLEAERARLVAAGIAAGEIEDAKDFYILRLSDQDGNLVVLASEER